MHINLHIDQITLEGIDLPRSQRPQLQAALREELMRLFNTQGIPDSLQKGGRLSNLPVKVTVADQPRPAQLAQQVAHSIYTRLCVRT
ncbi:MAG: hypothetical protein WA885_03665 [Phormidesmis sp.]